MSRIGDTQAVWRLFEEFKVIPVVGVFYRLSVTNSARSGVTLAVGSPTLVGNQFDLFALDHPKYCVFADSDGECSIEVKGVVGIDYPFNDIFYTQQRTGRHARLHVMVDVLEHGAALRAAHLHEAGARTRRR